MEMYDFVQVRDNREGYVWFADAEFYSDGTARSITYPYVREYVEPDFRQPRWVVSQADGLDVFDTDDMQAAFDKAYRLTVPSAVKQKFGGPAYVKEYFIRNVGFVALDGPPYLTVPLVRRLKDKGAVRFALVPVSEPDRNYSDFHISELIKEG